MSVVPLIVNFPAGRANNLPLPNQLVQAAVALGLNPNQFPSTGQLQAAIQAARDEKSAARISGPARSSLAPSSPSNHIDYSA